MAELDASGLTPLDASGLTPLTGSAPQLDAGGLVPLDASGLTPLETPGGSIGDYPVELGKGFLEGGKNTVATSLKGTAALAKGTERRALADMDLIEQGQRLPAINLRGGPADVMGVQDMPPEERQAQRATLQQAVDQPITDTNLYGAGQAIENFGKETLAPRPGFEGSLTRDIGSGFGSVATGVVLSLLQPEAAQLMWVTSGSGEAVDNAIRAGATPEQIERAAQFGSIPGATDAVDGMLPAIGSTGRALGLIKRVGLGAIKAAFAEGGQEGFQQFLQNLIARGIYKPDQDLLDDVPRSALIGAIVGGTVGGGTAAAERQARAAVPMQPGDQSAVPAETVLPAPAPDAGGASTFEQLRQWQPDPDYTRVESSPPAAAAPEAQAPAASIDVLPPDEASPIEQTLQGPFAGVSTGGVTDPSPQPQNAAIISPPSNEGANLNVGSIEIANALVSAGLPLNLHMTAIYEKVQALLAEGIPLDQAAAQAIAPAQPVANNDLSGGSPQQQEALPPVAGPTDTPVTAQTEPPTAPPQGVPHGRATLAKLLNDPRTADEIRAELQAQESIDPAGVMALPDAALTGRIIKAFESQFEDGKRVEGLRVTLPRGISYKDAGLLGPDGRLTYAGLQALKAEAARRAAIPAPAGSREAPVELATPADVHAGAEITNPNPTPAQAESGAIEDVAPGDLPKAAQYRVNSGSYSMLNGKRYSPSKTFWFLEAPDRRLLRNPLSNDPANPYTYRDTAAETVALAKKIIAAELEKKAEPEGAGERSKYTDVGIYRDRGAAGAYLGFKVRSTVIRLKAGFETPQAAREYLQENRDALQATIDAMRAGPNMRGTENRARTGEALREGDVTPDTFSNAFGFRGVQFGNYVEGPRRQADLNRAFDALMDLADVLDVPPQALSLNGELGLAFGARGTGGRNAAAAHYEPGRVVINLTKGGGPGSLAHEWLHALDNYFARQDKAGGYISERRRDSGPVRDEVYQAWKKVEAALQKGSFAERSAKFDEARSKPYWSTTIEKAARAFERYMVDRLAEKGAVNDYLANIDTSGGAYPTAAEMKSLGIREAFDQLFNTIETRATDRGTEMFSAAPRGWDEIEAGAPQRMSGAEIAKVSEIVQRVARTDPVFAEALEIPKGSEGARAWGLTEGGKAQGMYHVAADTIVVALDTGSPRAGYHEAFHRLQRHFLNTRERDILASEIEKLRGMIRGDITNRKVDRMSRAEVEAEAFAIYASNQDAGAKLNNILKRAWNRLRLMLNRLRNALKGMGYQTSEDIFGKARSGEIADRLGPIADRSLAPAYEDGRPVFSADAEIGADGKPQLVLPGAERSTKQQVQKRTAEPKRSSKPQKTVDGLPLFAREPDPQGDLFSLAEEPRTVVDGQRVMQGFLARGQYLDRAIRMPFDFFGGVTRDGQWKPGIKLSEKATNIITRAKFSPEGRFAFINPVMEAARSNLIDRYNLRNLPDYVARERQVSLDERGELLQANEILQSMGHSGVGLNEARVLHAIITEGHVGPEALNKLAEPIQAAIDDWGQQAVRYGLISAESFERNRGAYMNRSYRKHELEQNGLVRMVNKIGGSYRKRIVGNQLKLRGMKQELTLAQLMRDVPGWSEAERGKPVKGEKFIRLDEMPDQGRLQIEDANAPATEKPLRTVYWPADQAIPDRYSGFRNQGTWELRWIEGQKLVLWRDFTKAERAQMGEIADARYTFAKTALQAAHDLAVGKFYHDIAQNQEWASNQRPEGNVIDAAEWTKGLHAYKRQTYEWVRVPDSTIPDTGGKKRYGAIAGMYVREEIWRDLHELDVMTSPNAFASFWRAIMTQWKLNKTARSPTTHVNNVMSNFFLMDMMDVRMQDLAAGVHSYITGDKHYQEAFENGAFGADMISKEIRENTLKPILDEIAKRVTAQPNTKLGALGMVSKLTEAIWSVAKKGDRWMRTAYQAEDEVFRMATYMRRRALGDDPKQAAQVAREQFIDYDIRAPLVRAARNTVLPFISYSYRAIPLVANAVATRPWKIAKYAMLAYAANAIAYAMSGGDEDKERRSLREQEQGRTWLGSYRMTRMPFNDQYGNPMFIDARNWVPAGNVFDLGDGDIPPWLYLGGPLVIGAELALNRSSFTGQEIFNTKTEDWWERQSLRIGHAYKSAAPNAPWVPGSWAWDRIGAAYRGGTDRSGTPYSLPLAITSGLGLKLKPQDVEGGMMSKGQEINSIKRALDAKLRRMASQRARNMISQEAFDREEAAINKKLERLATKATETFE